MLYRRCCCPCLWETSTPTPDVPPTLSPPHPRPDPGHMTQHIPRPTPADMIRSWGARVEFMLTKGVSTKETNWIWPDWHTFQWQFVCSIWGKFQFVSGVDGPFVEMLRVLVYLRQTNLGDLCWCLSGARKYLTLRCVSLFCLYQEAILITMSALRPKIQNMSS